MHDLQRIGKVVTHLIVLGVKDPDGEHTSVFLSILPIYWENSVHPLCSAPAITETFFEDSPEWGVVRMISPQAFMKGGFGSSVLYAGGGGRGGVLYLDIKFSL